MDNKKDTTISDEVESRLQGLFEENGKATAAVKDSGDPEDTPLIGLKTTLLSIDWEITDEILTTLIKEIGKLEEIYKDDKTLLSFLRLISSAGKYIKTRKADAHPGAIKLLNSVYDSLEKAALSKDLTETKKRELLLDQVKEFKTLKEEVARRKAAAERKKEDEPSEEAPPQPDMTRMTQQDALAHVLAEIKQLIRDEFKALKAELKS